MSAAAAKPLPDPTVRQAVADLLTRSPAYHALSPEKKREVAQATALVADYLAVPEGIRGNMLPGGIATPPAKALDAAEDAAARASTTPSASRISMPLLMSGIVRFRLPWHAKPPKWPGC